MIPKKSGLGKISKMNRLFGKGKAKEPAPNLGDCIANVSSNFIKQIFDV